MLVTIFGGLGGGGGGGKESWLPPNDRRCSCWPVHVGFCDRVDSCWICWLFATSGWSLTEEESSQVSGIVNVDSGGLNVYGCSKGLWCCEPDFSYAEDIVWGRSEKGIPSPNVLLPCIGFVPRSTAELLRWLPSIAIPPHFECWRLFSSIPGPLCTCSC